MNVAFLGAELGRWDQALREEGAQSHGRIAAVGLPFFEDERPLRGAAGLCDWRLGGRLSRLLGSSGETKLRGAFGDRLLMPSGSRLPWERIVLFGLGPAAAFDDARAHTAARELLRTLHDLVPSFHPVDGVATHAAIALVPPGRSTGALSARQALEVLLEEAGEVFAGTKAPELLVIESAAGQKEAASLIRQA